MEREPEFSVARRDAIMTGIGERRSQIDLQRRADSCCGLDLVCYDCRRKRQHQSHLPVLTK